MSAGYPVRYKPTHPRATASGDVYVHVVVAEAALGHLLPDGAEVHHIDGDRRHNTPSNLVICQDKAYHKLLHVRAKIRAAGGDPNVGQFCNTCKAFLPYEAFNRSWTLKSTGRCHRCRACSRDYQRTYVRPSKRRQVA